MADNNAPGDVLREMREVVFKTRCPSDEVANLLQAIEDWAARLEAVGGEAVAVPLTKLVDWRHRARLIVRDGHRCDATTFADAIWQGANALISNAHPDALPDGSLSKSTMKRLEAVAGEPLTVDMQSVAFRVRGERSREWSYQDTPTTIGSVEVEGLFSAEQIAALQRRCAFLAARLQAAEARCAELDAANDRRYRWLRDCAFSVTAPSFDLHWQSVVDERGPDYTLDAAIDAALHGQQGESNG